MAAPKKTPPKKKPVDEDTEDTEDTESEDTEDQEGDDKSRSDAENRRINAIVTSRVRREMKTVNATLQALQESIKALAPGKKTDDDEDHESESEDGEKKKVITEDPKITRKLSKMEKELAEERAARKEAEKRQAEEAEKTRVSEMRGIYSNALSELGVSDPKLLRAALNVLQEDGVMFRDDDGKVKFKGQDKYGIETAYEPKVGLKSWIAGDGKSFVPAIDAGGSGTGGTPRGNLNANQIKKMSPQQIAAINFDRAFTGEPQIGTDE